MSINDTSPAAFDADGRVAFLRALVGEPPVDGARLWIASHQPPGDPNGSPSWTQYPTTSLLDAANRLRTLAERGEVYVSLAWFKPDGGRVKECVVSKGSVSADVDDKSMPGATPDERHHNARTLAGALPATHVLVDSGHGFHVHVLLAESDRVEHFVEADDGVRRVELLGRALRLFFEDKARELFGVPVALDHCHGAERVWRIPPGWNCKRPDGTKGLTADRGDWKAVRLAYPGRVEGLAAVVPGDLSCLVPFVEAAQEEAEQGAKGGVVATRADVTLGGHSLPRTRVATFHASRVAFSPSILPDHLQRRWPLDGTDQSDHDFEVAAALAKDGWAPEVAVEALRQRRALLREPDDREKGLRQDYLRRTALAAYARAARPTPPRGVEPFVPFPVDVLPSPLPEFLRAGQEALTCAVEAIVLPLLTALGAMIGNTRRIQLKRTWSEPALLWSCVILGSGKTKSPAQELALRQHVVRQKRAFAQFKVDYRRYAEAMVTYKRELREWDKSGTGDAPQAPQKPTLFRIVVSEATIEAITPILEENPRGLLMTRDELSGWMKSFDAYRNGKGSDREHWLSAHRAHSIIVDRKTDREARFVEHGFIAVCGGTQPGILRRLCTDEAFQSGLVARLLLTWPTSPRKRWTDVEIPRAVQTALERVFERLLSLEMVMPGEGGLGIDGTSGASREAGPGLVPLSAEALLLWRAFYDEFAVEQEGIESEEALAAAFAKLEAYAARFALILEHVEWAASKRKEPPTLIGPESMRAGIVLARWFAAEATRVYQLLAEDAREQKRARLISWIAAQTDPVTAHDVVRGPRIYRSAPEAAHADLEGLVAFGLAWRLPMAAPRNGGDATTAYVLRANVNPLERGDARSREVSPDKDLRTRASPEGVDLDTETPP